MGFVQLIRSMVAICLEIGEVSDSLSGDCFSAERYELGTLFPRKRFFT
jgi:hypothetical protein